MPDAPGAGAQVTFGLLALAGVDVALPIATLREVVPCPEAFAPLPSGAEGLLGAISVRDLVVPVLDLRSRIAPTAPRPRDEVVVIVTDDERVLGLLADGAREIVRVPGDAVRAVGTQEAGLLFSQSFHHPADGRVVSALDVDALLALPGMPTVRDAGAAAQDRVATARPRGRHRTLTVMGCGEHRLAVEVAHVHTTLGSVVPRPSSLDSRLCLGVVSFSGREVAVVDPLVLLGLGRLDADGAGGGLVVACAEGYVVLAVTAVLDIVDVDEADLLPVPAFALRRPELLEGIADLPGAGQSLLLDGAAVAADSDVAALGAMNLPLADGHPDADAAGRERSGPATGPVYLTFTLGAGVVVATPLEQVAEIVRLPEARTPTAAAGAVAGVAVHRDRAVAIVCLATVLGLPAPELHDGMCLLLVHVDGDTVGFAVDALRSIDALTWREDRADRADSAGTGALTGVLGGRSLIAVGSDERLVPEVDLVEIGHEVRAAAPAPAPAATRG